MSALADTGSTAAGRARPMAEGVPLPKATAAPAEGSLRLEDARARVRAAWQGARHDPVPLPVVAARAVHEALGARGGVVSRTDYELSLNLAAAALARLVPICRLDRLDGWVELGAPGADGGRFIGGATALRRAHGELVAPLAIRRLDADLALRFLRKHGLAEGLPLSTALAEGLPVPTTLAGGSPLSTAPVVGSPLPIATVPGT